MEGVNNYRVEWYLYNKKDIKLKRKDNEMKNIVLSEITCPELSKYKEDIELALISTGSHEQHGSNMTFAADTDIVYEICKLLGKNFFPRILVCPPISYGISYHL